MEIELADYDYGELAIKDSDLVLAALEGRALKTDWSPEFSSQLRRNMRETPIFVEALMESMKQTGVIHTEGGLDA